MTDRTARTEWEGALAKGKGRTEFASSGIGTFDVSWPARAESPDGKTSPEEMLAAAHSSCFSMALSAELGVALAELPYRQRACWLLREVEGMTHPEIGAIMTLSAGAVRGQLTRARATLSERLATWRTQ